LDNEPFEAQKEPYHTDQSNDTALYLIFNLTAYN